LRQVRKAATTYSKMDSSNGVNQFITEA